MSTPLGPSPSDPQPEGGPSQYPGQWGAPPPGSYPPPAGSYPPPTGSYPPPAGSYPPPPAGSYPPPAGAYSDAQQPGLAPGMYPPPGSVNPGGLPPAPEPAKKKRMTPQRIIILSIVGVLVIGVGIWAFISSQKATVNAKPGDCIKVEGGTTVGNPDTSQVDCNDPAALFVVTETGDQNLSCDEAEAEYYQKNSKGDVTDRICLRPNFQTGECFVPAPTTVQLPKVGDCTTISGSTKYKVLLFDTTTADESKCPSDSVGVYSSTKRNYVVCFGDA